MNMIMLNWGLLLVALVSSTNADPLNRDGTSQADEIVYETPAEGVLDFQPASECTVQGIWYNSLGSELILNVSATGQLSGEFRTGVERSAGSAGTGPGQVIGWTSHDGSHNSVSFTVLWRNGASVSAWTGLCHVCNGVELMKTTWLLTSEVDTCGDHWASNRIGQDDFTRFEQVPGPRRRFGTHTPLDVAQRNEQLMAEQEQPDEQLMAEQDQPDEQLREEEEQPDEQLMAEQEQTDEQLREEEEQPDEEEEQPED